MVELKGLACDSIHYSEPGIILFKGDCLELLPLISGRTVSGGFEDLKDTVDLLLTDPPYGNNYDPRGVTKRRDKWCPAKEFQPIKGNAGPFDPGHLLEYKKSIIWGANHFADMLPSRPGWIIWDKREGIPSNNQADCELAWTDILTVPRIHRQLWNGLCRRGEENISKHAWRMHPFQKPVELMRYCLSVSGLEPGDIVLDPYMGSGPVAQACKEMGFRYIGIEDVTEYLDRAVDRLRQGIFI